MMIMDEEFIRASSPLFLLLFLFFEHYKDEHLESHRQAQSWCIAESQARAVPIAG